MTLRRRTSLVALVGATLVTAGLTGFALTGLDRGDPRLTSFVSTSVDYPIVFTSRSGPASFRAAAKQGDYAPGGAAIRDTGRPQWQEAEGRLRVLTTGGRVRELTWGKTLPDGGVLVDVMSPSVSPDAAIVYFAGRRADGPGQPGGRFRLYAVGLDGSGLRPVTGTPDDPGCSVVPPLRFAADGSTLSDSDRKRLDYDDVDPTALPDGTVFFASSRLPDLGNRDRRATQLWVKEPGRPSRPHTASRANDRWPALTVGRELLFTLWSRQDEVVAADGLGIARYDPPAAGLTAPADRWVGVTVTATGEAFGQAVKVATPVWRVRPLFTGNLAYMTLPPRAATPFTPAEEFPEAGPLRVAQSRYGQVASAPSSLAAGSQYPALAEPPVLWCPAATADGRRWSLGTPGPAPGGRLLVAASPLGADGRPVPASYGLYAVPENGWPADPAAVGELAPIFDDPDLVDAEPVVAYPRPLPPGSIEAPHSWDADQTRRLSLAGGQTYTGPAGDLHCEQLSDAATGRFPGQRADGPDPGPVVPLFGRGAIARVAFYASHRDRFDDPVRPVVRGTLEKLIEAPAAGDRTGSLRVTLPVGSPTLLVGIGADGQVVSATGAADASGRRGKFYAFAGDHVSGTRAGGYHFCTGCHTGHTFGGVATERLK